MGVIMWQLLGHSKQLQISGLNDSKHSFLTLVGIIWGLLASTSPAWCSASDFRSIWVVWHFIAVWSLVSSTGVLLWAQAREQQLPRGELISVVIAEMAKGQAEESSASETLVWHTASPVHIPLANIRKMSKSTAKEQQSTCQHL